MVDKYKTASLVGLVVQQDNTGNFVPSKTELTASDFHTWRIGKHTKGRLAGPGQLFLTENNLTVVLLASQDLPFKQRHDFVPMGRFLPHKVATDVLENILENYEKIIKKSK